MLSKLINGCKSSILHDQPNCCAALIAALSKPGDCLSCGGNAHVLLQVAPSAEVATAKNLGTCKEFLVEDTYPAPPRPALSCISSSSSMTSMASATPANKHEVLNTLASAAERSAPQAQHAEPLDGHLGKPGSEQVATSVPGSAFGQHGQQASPPFKADAGRQSAAAKPDASAASLASAAAPQALAAIKALPAAGQPGVNVLGQLQAHSSSSSKSEASKGAMAARTLMYFKGSPCALGCTVLLKGAPRHVLASVKKVMEVGVRLQPLNAVGKPFVQGIVDGTCRCTSLNHIVSWALKGSIITFPRCGVLR